MKKDLQSLQDLLLLKLRALYDVENTLVKALPKMAEHATDPELKAGFEQHLRETEQHVRRLEHAFEAMGYKPEKIKVEAIRGLITDAEWIMKQVPKGQTLDPMLIAAAQYVEHYEIAGYGTAREWADLLGHTDVEEILRQTLDEEKHADEILNVLATDRINQTAMV